MGLQRRLFLFFLLSGLLPLTLLAAILWLPLKQQFRIWSLPTVESALEAALDSNRHSLDRHRRQLEDLGQQLASQPGWAGEEHVRIDAGRGHTGVDLAQYYSRSGADWTLVGGEPESVADISTTLPEPIASSVGPQRSRPLTFREENRDFVAVPSYVWAETDSGAYAVGCLVLGTALGPGFFGDLERASQGLVFYRRFEDLGKVLRYANLLWIGLALVVSFLLSALFARRVARGISRPVETLAEGMAAVGQGSDPGPIEPTRIPEMAALSVSFGEMREKLKTFEQQLRETERVRATQDTARFVAHEIRNALTPVKAGLSVLQKRVDSLPEESRPQGRQALEMIRAEADRMAHLAKTFSEYAHLPEPKPSWTLLEPMVDGVSREVAEPIVWQLEGNLTGVEVCVDPEDFERILRNLTKNAVEAMDGPGTLTLRVTRPGQNGEAGTEIVGLVLEDTGPGMDATTLTQIWHPGFTTKATGSGLGLSLVRRSIIGYGGSLDIVSEIDNGTQILIELPARIVKDMP